jgi:hypothetical protein
MSAKEAAAAAPGSAAETSSAANTNGRLKLDNLSKFNGKKENFPRYHIKLKAAAKLNGCGEVMKKTTAEVKAAIAANQKSLIALIEILYTIIILTIADDEPTGEELLLLLAANCEANGTIGRMYDNGHAAYHMLVERFAGQQNLDTTSLYDQLNNTKLNGNDVQKYESEMITLFNKIAIAAGQALQDS